MVIVLWFFIFMIIILAVKGQEKQENVQKEIAKKIQQSYPTKDSKNSYYSKKKIESYHQMNQMHEEHEEMVDDVCCNIGYKRCPKCDSFVSKKADTCFMCNYDFQQDTKKEESN